MLPKFYTNILFLHLKMFENLWFHNVSGGVEIEHCRKMGSCVYKTLLHLADLFEDYKLLVAVRNFYARTLVLFSFVFFFT